MIGFTRPKRFCVPENKHYTAVETKALDALEAACEEANVELERLRAELSAAKAVIENIVVSEVEPLKALLRESVREAFDSCYVLHPDGVDLLRRIRVALGEEP